MNKNYYFQYYKLEREHWWFRIRAKIIMEQVRLLKLPPNSKILNIGAATFKSSELLSEFGEVTSIEYDEACCEFVTQELKQEVSQGSITELDFEADQFDLVCAFDVIEHVEDDALAINEMYRVCKKNGIIFITVPAYQFLWSKHDEINHHFRRYTLGALEKKVSKLPVNVKFGSYFNTLLFPLITLFRVYRNVFKKNEEVDSDFENFDSKRISNKLFSFLFNQERHYLKRRLKFPFGVSCMVVGEKTG